MRWWRVYLHETIVNERRLQLTIQLRDQMTSSSRSAVLDASYRPQREWHWRNCTHYEQVSGWQLNAGGRQANLLSSRCRSSHQLSAPRRLPEIAVRRAKMSRGLRARLRHQMTYLCIAGGSCSCCVPRNQDGGEGGRGTGGTVDSAAPGQSPEQRWRQRSDESRHCGLQQDDRQRTDHFELHCR